MWPWDPGLTVFRKRGHIQEDKDKKELTLFVCQEFLNNDAMLPLMVWQELGDILF